MKPWPQPHRTLAKLATVAAAGCAAAYLFLVRPLAAEVNTTRTTVQEKLKKLNATGWPLDAERLESLREQKKRELDQMGRNADEVIKQATSMFNAKMAMFGGSSEEFVTEVSRLEYQDMYNQLAQRLGEQGIVLAEEVLKLGENSSWPYVYQLVLQLWTLETAVDLALKNSLAPAKDPTVSVATESGTRQQVSQLTLLPIRAYYLTEADKEPYVLEIPVRMTLRGKIGDVCAFLRSVHGPNIFLPVSHLEIQKLVPAGDASNPDFVRATVVCSAFVTLHEKAAAGSAPSVQKSGGPRGA